MQLPSASVDDFVSALQVAFHLAVEYRPRRQAALSPRRPPSHRRAEVHVLTSSINAERRARPTRAARAPCARRAHPLPILVGARADGTG